MKNKSLKVMAFGFPKLGTLFDFKFAKGYVIGYEKQMSIVDVMFLGRGNIYTRKVEYNKLINGIICNYANVIDNFNASELVSKVNKMEGGKFYLTKDGFNYILKDKSLAFAIYNNTAKAIDYNEIKEKYYYEIVNKQLIINSLCNNINFRLNAFPFLDSSSRKINDLLKNKTLSQLIENIKFNKRGNLFEVNDSITASLMKLRDEITENKENFIDAQ